MTGSQTWWEGSAKPMMLERLTEHGELRAAMAVEPLPGLLEGDLSAEQVLRLVLLDEEDYKRMQFDEETEQGREAVVRDLFDAWGMVR